MPDRSKTRAQSKKAPPADRRTNPILLLLAIGVPAVLVTLFAVNALGGSASVLASPTPGSTEITPSGDAAVLVREDSPTLGSADAPVTLVEFLDPECEACRAFYPIVKEVMAEYDGQVRLVVRYVPGHGNSALAAIALEAAREQDETKYWEMLELLFERQPEWGEQPEPQPQAFLDAASAVGLDTTPIEAAMAAGDTTMVERDLADAQAVGLRGTPTFFVNGVQVDDLSPDGLRAAIDAALAG